MKSISHKMDEENLDRAIYAELSAIILGTLNIDFDTFVEDECDIGPNESIKFSRLYLAFCRWTDRQGLARVSVREFSELLKREFRVITSPDYLMIVGITLHRSHPMNPENYPGLWGPILPEVTVPQPIVIRHPTVRALLALNPLAYGEEE